VCEQWATITFNDNGVGFIEGDNTERHGIVLVRRLMGQVNGAATARSDHGTDEWTLRFPLPATAMADETVTEP
jgi:two-component sensor histidine kinase